MMRWPSAHKRTRGIVKSMPKGKIWTAEELLALTPNERFDAVKSGFVNDLGEVPPGLLEQTRDDIRSHVADTESPAPNEP